MNTAKIMSIINNQKQNKKKATRERESVGEKQSPKNKKEQVEEKEVHKRRGISRNHQQSCDTLSWIGFCLFVTVIHCDFCCGDVTSKRVLLQTRHQQTKNLIFFWLAQQTSHLIELFTGAQSKGEQRQLCCVSDVLGGCSL